MGLSAGDKLGPYEIVAPIGKGGMGEVYRARDANLKREVALKVLPAAFLRDPGLIERWLAGERIFGAEMAHPAYGDPAMSGNAPAG
jgi:serine/threonine protein kinase